MGEEFLSVGTREFEEFFWKGELMFAFMKEMLLHCITLLLCKSSVMTSHDPIKIINLIN